MRRVTTINHCFIWMYQIVQYRDNAVHLLQPKVKVRGPIVSVAVGGRRALSLDPILYEHTETTGNGIRSCFPHTLNGQLMRTCLKAVFVFACPLTMASRSHVLGSLPNACPLWELNAWSPDRLAGIIPVHLSRPTEPTTAYPYAGMAHPRLGGEIQPTSG